MEVLYSSIRARDACYEDLLALMKDWPLSDFFSLSLSLAWAFFSGDYAYNINSFPKFLSLYKSTINLSLYNLNLSNISME